MKVYRGIPVVDIVIIKHIPGVALAESSKNILNNYSKVTQHRR